MTIIAASEDTNQVCIATDSLGSYDNLKIEFGSKLISKKNYTLSNAGSYRVGDVLEEYECFPNEIRDLNDLRKFRDELINIVRSYEFLVNPRNEDNYPNISIIIVSPHGIFTIEDDFQIHTIETGFYASGTGEEVAMGALYTCKSLGLDAKTSVQLACEASIHSCITCGGAIHYKSFKKPF